MTFAEVPIAAVITSVHTQYTLHSLNVSDSIHFTCVPVVVAAGPRQLGAEGEHEVEQSPGQNNDVGHTAVEEDQLPSVADTCRTRFNAFCYRQSLQKPDFLHLSILQTVCCSGLIFPEEK